jgi:putative FmdB family regulatory protein
MPLYEYECKQCHRHTEKIQKFSDPEITTCPHCGGPLERVISAPAIAFKGGGWFKDGYGNAKPSSAAAESTADAGNNGAANSSSDAATAPSTSGDTKAAAAPSTPAPAPAAAPASASGSDKK